jgi:cobyrinic acid a,c-diamide synthase
MPVFASGRNRLIWRPRLFRGEVSVLRRGGLILAAPASGSGKTLVTAGLLRRLRERGWRVAAAKAGPDYIDPTFHAAASGGSSVNLDPWAMRPESLQGLVAALEAAADIVLCEGVMGLFDGTGPDGEAGSTAALARLTGWPVVLVVDARGQGASAAALVAGFARHDPAVPLAGVLFNRVAGPRHRELLTGALARHLPELPCLGALPADPELALPQRHLGLVPAGERAAAAEAAIARAAATVAAHVDVDGLVALVRPAQGVADKPSPPFRGEREGPIAQRWEGEVGVGGRSGIPHLTPALSVPRGGEGVTTWLVPPLASRIAVATDDAFLFAYPAVLEGWRRQGAELSFFSPLADEPPDPTADAVYLPGGYPELHAGRLAAAERFRAGLRQAAVEGKAVYGECGGYMVLGERLTDAAGGIHRAAGLLPLATSFAERRLHLGYREAVLLCDGPLGPAGSRFRGHEFHYATTLSEAADAPLFGLADASGNDLGTGGMRCGPVMGSFIHLIDRAGE